MKRSIFAFLLVAILCSFNIQGTLKGDWEYAGGVYNGKPQDASKDYTLRRQYHADNYEALFIEKDEKPVIYETGNYMLKNDTCLETQTYSLQPSKTLDIPIKYQYQIKNDTLSFSGKLPNGTVVKEFWKKIK